MILGINKIKEDLLGLDLFGKLWIGVAFFGTLFISLYMGDSWIGIVSALTNILCVILVANGKISNYFWGLIGVVAYAYVAFTNKYYGDFMLNSLYYLPMQFVGWYMWKKNSNDSETVESKFLLGKQRVILFAISLLSIYGYGTFLKSLGGNLPYIDATSTVLSVVAMYLMAKQYMEQWILWVVVNIVTIYMWLQVFLSNGNEIATLIQWIIFLINSLYGLYSWIKRHKEIEYVKQ